MENLNETYGADEQVTGNCYSSYSEFDIKGSSSNSFYVSTRYFCSLVIQRRTVLNFGIALKLDVEAIPLADTMNFKLKCHQEEVTFYSYDSYKIVNQEKANKIVKDAMKFI